MKRVTVEANHSYRLRFDFEVRVPESGTMKYFFRKGEVLKVKKVEPDLEQVWIEGCPLPISLDVIESRVDEASSQDY